MRPCSSRLSTSVSPRMSNSWRCSASIWPLRFFSLRSMTMGWPTSVSTSSRMMAPKPQQMQSRNDSVKTSNSRRLPSAMVCLLDGQSREGMTYEPPVLRASRQNACAASRSPFMGSSTTSIGTSRVTVFAASSNSFSRSRALMNLRDGGTEPCVGRPSVIRMIWSGCGLMVRIASKRVDEAGAVRRRDVARRGQHVVDDARIVRRRATCRCVSACTAFALVLKPYTWNWLLSGSCAVIHSTMSSARRHLSAARRAASGWLRSRMIFDHVLVHHAGGRIEQHQDALALHVQRADVLAVAAAAERLDARARRTLVERAALQALDALFQRLDVGLQLVDVLAAREALFVVLRRLLAALP